VTTELAPRVWRITTPLPFRPREVHAYLVRLEDDRVVLVDGGVGTTDAWAALDAAVREVAGEWRRVVLHVVTHMHLDHMGLAGRVREASGARLVMGRLDADRAEHAAAEPDEEAGYRLHLLRSGGAPAEVVAAIEDGYARGGALAPFSPPDVRLEGEGGALEAAPGWRWVWTPGHTAGHISIFRPADGVLIAGDAVLGHITPTIGVNRQRTDPVGDYLQTLARLESLRPATALAGHGEPLRNPMRRIAELREATEQESTLVLDCLTAEPATAWTVAGRRHPRPDLPPATRMLALRETLAHLERLVAAGFVHRDDDADGVRRFGSRSRPGGSP
jgi:glyoxylase-like metal-dependent hydrolase (beta-lactamase superfamily II)